MEQYLPPSYVNFRGPWNNIVADRQHVRNHKFITLYLLGSSDYNGVSDGSGDLEGGSYTGDFERWMREGSGNGSSPSVGALWGEPVGRAPLLRIPKDMISKALEMGVCFHRVPVLGNMGGSSFRRAFERMVKFLFYRQKCKRRLWKWTNLSIGPSDVEPGGCSFTGTSGETDESGFCKRSIFD